MLSQLHFLASGGVPIPGLSLDPKLSLILAFLLVLLNGFFVAAEFAIVKVRPTQIQPHEGTRRGRLAAHMLKELDAYLSGTQLGITLSSLALGWIGEPAFAWVLEPLLSRLPFSSPALLHTVSLTISFLVITILHIVLGELAPKSLAIRKPEATSLWIALPLYAFYKVTYPAIFVLNWAANLLLKAFGIEPVSESELAHSEEELRLLLSSDEGGSLSEQKRELIDNIFELSARTARQTMLPRGDIVYLSTTRSVAENVEIARRSGHTRFPVCEGEIDKIIGLVHIKDFFRAASLPSSLSEIQREITFVPETLPLDRLLRRMRQERSHLVAVLDEYGGVSGMITLENVIEEIVGQIQDEFDRETPQLEEYGPKLYWVDGSMLIADLENELELELSDRDEDTVGGVVLSELGRRPLIGDRVVVGPLALEVRELERNRIRRLKLSFVDSPETLDAAAAGDVGTS